MSNLIVTKDDSTNFTFSASFSDYLQGSANTTYFTGTVMTGASAAADEFSATSHILIYPLDSAASYAIGDQINFSAVINSVQETIPILLLQMISGQMLHQQQKLSQQILLLDLNPQFYN